MINRKSQRGVALVITLLMLAIVLIMAVLFLGISRRERESVTGTVEQTTARNAADHGQSRAVAETIARITSQNNPFAYGMAVSTNLLNPNGFQPGLSSFNNVGYTYANGQPLSGNDIRINQANLFYDARPPVFFVNNSNVTEFRYYLDLNRNRRFDTNGYRVAITANGQSTGETNYYFGDPEWIGILEHPDQPHSASNRFIGRYAFLVAPAGRTLDINYMHNNARDTSARPPGVGYFRNQGVGSWELNLAAFLRDLNTNAWPGDPVGYHYNPSIFVPSASGTAFQDALSILTNRCLGNFQTLNSVEALFGSKGSVFQNDQIDEYGDDRQTTGLRLNVEGTTNRDTTRNPWFGSENTNGFTRIDELFDPRKVSSLFAARLTNALANPGTYNQDTYYRLIAQLGTDSLPANRLSGLQSAQLGYPGSSLVGKLNLNYDNVNQVTGQIDPGLVTGLTNWTPIRFFTNAADLMLRSQSSSLLSPLGITNITLSANFIPVNLYFSSVHRLLQLAANIQDATTNRYLLAAGTNSLYAPSVFRPLFGRKGTNIFISGFEEVFSTNVLRDDWVDLNNPSVAFLQIKESNPTNRVNVYGIPYVIGAKKGFPNFNELLLQSTVQVTRRLEVFKNRREDDPVFHQSYEIGITNYMAMEAWNSYTQAFPRALQMIVTNSSWLAFSNATPGYPYLTTKSLLTPNTATLLPNNWKGQEFRVPMSNSVVFIPNSEFSFSNPLGLRQLQETISFDGSQGFPVPDWKLNITNRLQYILVDSQSGRIVDFVNLDRIIGGMDITSAIVGQTNAFGDSGLNPGSFWLTNRVRGIADAMTWGITNQIYVSTNDVLAAGEWASFTDDPISGKDKENGIDKFRIVMGLPPLFSFDNTNVTYPARVQVPFTPTRKLDQKLSWQVNDPLVHYHIEDLYDPLISDVHRIDILKPSHSPPPSNIGQINDPRYKPWGGNPNNLPGSGPLDYNLAVKDPLITQSDDWDFPTNKFPNIGWLGRVHRGTPWQTVYLKSQAQKLQGDTDGWISWAGRADTHPTNDWALLSLFTTAPNDAAARGLLSVNQTNIAAWSAVLSGVSVLSNNLANWFIEPASPQLYQIVSNINATRLQMPGQVFPNLGSVLRSPALTVASPYLNTRVTAAQKYPLINDEMYERIPQQILSLLKDDDPYVVIYAFGQTLKPANDSIVTLPGPYRGLCTNYQVSAEVATKTAVRIQQLRQPSGISYKAIVESYSILPTD
jgi:hypothetical protein